MGVDVSFKDDLAAAREAEATTADVAVELNGHRHVLRFSRMNPVEYAEETLRHPPRLEIGVDREFGYNLTSLTVAVAPRCAVLIDGETSEPLSAEEWADVFAAADAGAIQNMQNTVFHLNEFASSKAADAARKVVDAFGGVSPLQ
jgi:hypothetical protein